MVKEIEVHRATAVSEPPPCSPIHIPKLSRAVQWCVCMWLCVCVCVCVLSCEGKPAVSVQLVCLHTWVGERPRCEARDRKGEGVCVCVGGMDGGIRADVIRESWSACQQWLALVHTQACTHSHIDTLDASILTHRGALRFAQLPLQRKPDWTTHTFNL